MRFTRNTLTFFYAIAVLFLICIIGYVASYLYASTIDAHHYSFNQTWYENAKLNFDKLNGRWSQGFTNDHRFYIYRLPVTVLLNVTFFVSIWYFFKALFKRWSFVIASVFYFAFLLNSFNFYQVAYLLNTALSYTLGISLLFFFYGYILRNGFKLNFKDYRTWLAILLTIFLTGLVEHLFFVNIAILGFLLVYHWLGKKQINKGMLFYFGLNIVGAAVTLLSPGLRKRREVTAIRNEKLGRDTSIDFTEFFNTLGSQIELNANWMALGFFVFFFLFFIGRYELRSQYTINKLQLVWLFIFILLIPICPILLGYVGSNGIVGMPKAYNLFSFLFLTSLVFIAFGVAYIFPKKSSASFYSYVLKSIAVLLILVFIGYSFFKDERSQLHFQQRQVFSGDIKKPYFDELARRQYLMETYYHHQTKVIPALSLEYNGKVDGAHRGNAHPMYYDKRFNSNMPIKVSNDLLLPREYATAFLVENGKLGPISQEDGFDVYYNKTLRVLLFKATTDTIFKNQELKDFSITVSGKEFFGKKEETLFLKSKQIYNKKEKFYNQYPSFFCVQLPLYTSKIQIEPFGILIDAEDAKIQSKIEYDFNYGKIMR